VRRGQSRERADSDSCSSTSESEELEGTLRHRKADQRLFKHVPESHGVFKEFLAALKKESTSADATKKSAERLSLFLGYAEDLDSTQMSLALLGLRHLGCFAHGINLIVAAAIAASINASVDKAKSFCSIS